jgi:hypothetical protein
MPSMPAFNVSNTKPTFTEISYTKLRTFPEEVNKDRLYRALDHLLAHSTFDSTTSTYTLYVGQTFNQVQVDYNQTVTGNATFTVNNITYDEKSTIPSTDLLFDVSAVDSDGDSAATSLQVNLQGSTTGATGLALTGTSGSDVLSGSSGSDPAVVTSSTMTSSVIVAATDTPRHADFDQHARRYQRRQSVQRLRDGRLADEGRSWLRQLHHDGGRYVGLHARQQQRGKRTQYRRQADQHHPRWIWCGPAHGRQWKRCRKVVRSRFCIGNRQDRFDRFGRT